ncbi:helix-turn-helix domain-containing protein [Kitasatospora sp. NPDC057940]|uniref:helix-turn-helix domain-containing protein n=1 Tax=Kitasatospora sp. NPDC057940 TaxID=3346285 RepID=UPI0036D88C5C
MVLYSSAVEDSKMQWPSALTARIAQTIKTQRGQLGMTTADLSSACEARGVPIAANTITKIEKGKRDSLKLEEAIVLAHALDLPLVALLIPLMGQADIDLLPNVTTPVWQAAAWITGEDYPGDAPHPGSARAVLAVFREHDVDVRTALISTREAHNRRLQARQALGSARYEQLSRRAEELDRMAHEDCARLKALRDQMRVNGLQPAPLPAALEFVEAPTSPIAG